MMRLLVDNEGCDIYTTLVRYNRLGVALVKTALPGSSETKFSNAQNH